MRKPLAFRKRAVSRATCTALAAVFAVTLLLSTGATTRNAEAAGTRVTLKGSDTMVILGQRWAELYMREKKGAVIQVTGGGSGTGIAALINGTTDICQSSRPMKDDEKKKLRERYNTMGQEIAVAKDGLAVYLNEANSVTELTLKQLGGIYMGTITNWKDVGGNDAPIVLYGRENNSGTYVFFKDNVLGGKDFSARTQTLPGTAAVVNAVAKDPNGVGYGGAAYGKGIRFAKLKKDAISAAIAPSTDSVKDGSYPLTRNLFWYTRVKPKGETKAFLDWVLSAEGQSIVTEVGYYPIH